MNFLDKTISFFSPERGYKRQLYREELALSVRHAYDAAGGARLNAGWHAAIESAEMADRCSRDQLRARARDLERNSDVANGIINAFVRNVVGKGFTLQAKTGRPELDDQLEAIWRRWTRARYCDVTGQQSFTQMLRMAVKRKKVDGGILFLKCYTAGGLVPFKLQALEVDELCASWASPHSKENRVAGGVEFDPYNRPVGYWIQQYTVDGMACTTPKYYAADDVIFLYSKRRPSQVREVTDLAPTLSRIRDSNQFLEAVSIKERIAACLSIFVKKAVPVGGFGRNGQLGAGGSVDYSAKRLAPGMITEMGAGDDIQVVDPKSSATDATAFLKLQQRMIAAGHGLSYEATSRDMSETTYSSARQGAIEDELTYVEETELLRDKLLTEVYESFVISAVLSGAVSIPDFWAHKAEYLAHEWIASPKRWVDPQKDADANLVALQTGQKTFQQITAELGRDWRDQINEMAEAQAYAAEKGVNIVGGYNNDTTKTGGNSAE